MKLFKKILAGLGILITIPLVLAIFIDKDFAIEREITIQQPRQLVFDYLKLIKNQSFFSTWTMMDPQMKQSFRGEDGTVGFVSAWESEKMGNGEQELKKIVEGERIETELRFGGAFPSSSPAYFITEAVSDNQTKVKWGMSGRMAYPMNFMRLFMDMDKMVGSEYQKSLENLKTILEKQQN